MIDLAAIGASSVLATATAMAGWFLGRRHASGERSTEASRVAASLVAQRDAAERRAREAQSECQRWRSMSLATGELSTEPLVLGRPAPRDAEALANLIRGLVLVDDAVLTDRSGLPLTRELDGVSGGLAAIGGASAAFMRRLAGAGLPVVQVAIETFTADHLCVRALVGRGEGALLVVKTTSQPVSPLAVDAVVHAAARRADELPSTSTLMAMRGATETRSVDAPTFSAVFRELGDEVRGELSGVMLTSEGQPLFSSVKDGPPATVRALVASELAAVQARVGILLRGAPVARVDAVLRDGSRLGWATIAPSSKLALVTFGRTDARLVARLRGRLRRAMNERNRFPEQENAA